MKTSLLLFISLVILASCQKEAKVAPANSSVIPVKTPVVASTITDTIPDHAAFKIKLVKDSSNNDETLFVFNKSAKAGYDDNEDAAYFSGFGAEGLASISNNGEELAINVLPYTPGMSIGLDVRAQTDGKLTLKFSYQNKLPENIQVWVKDTYLKDSVNVRTANYSFNVIKADPNSFGSKRFKLIVKSRDQTVGSIH